MNNPLYTERELKQKLNDSDSKVAVCFDLLLPRILKLKEETALESIIIIHINDYLPFPKKQLYLLVKADRIGNWSVNRIIFFYVEIVKIRRYGGEMEQCW